MNLPRTFLFTMIGLIIFCIRVNASDKLSSNENRNQSRFSFHYEIFNKSYDYYSAYKFKFQYKLNSHSAIRTSIKYLFDRNNYETSNFHEDSYNITDVSDNNNYEDNILNLELHYVKNLQVSVTNVLYAGLGPTFSYDRYDHDTKQTNLREYVQDDRWYLDDDKYRTKSITWTTGLQLVIGNSWFFRKNISIDAEWGIHLYYSHNTYKNINRESTVYFNYDEYYPGWTNRYYSRNYNKTKNSLKLDTLPHTIGLTYHF